MRTDNKNDYKVTSCVLQRKNGNYYIMLSWYEDSERKRESHSIGEEHNRAKAKRRGIELALEKEKELIDRLLAKDNHIFVDSLTAWIEQKRNSVGMRTNSVDGYQERSKNIIKFFNALSEARGDDVCVEDIKAKDLRLFYETMLTIGKVDRKTGAVSPLAKATVDGYASMLHKFFEDKKKLDKWIITNPCDEVSVPKVDEELKEEKYFTYDQLRKLIQFFESNQRFRKLSGITKICVLYGLRRSECLALRWDYVDWERNCIDIRRSVVRVHGGVEEKKRVKAKGSYRTYPILPEVKAVLMQNMEEQKKMGIYSDDGLVFLTDKGAQWSPDYCSKLFKMGLVACGFPEGMSFKTMRSTCVCIAHEKNWSDSWIIDWVGHTSFKVTRNNYLEPTRILKENMGKTLEGVF